MERAQKIQIFAYIDQNLVQHRFTIWEPVEGTSSKIYRAQRIQDGRHFCIKIYKKLYIQTYGAHKFIKEKLVLEELQRKGYMEQKDRNSEFYDYIHYIQKIIDSGTNGYKEGTKSQNMYFLILEYYQGSLLSYLRTQQYISESNYKTIFIQIVKGLKLMHYSQGIRISHGDLSLFNVLVNNQYCKICDFGISTIGDENVNGEAKDIQALGIILLALVCGLFSTRENADQLLQEISQEATSGDKSRINHILEKLDSIGLLQNSGDLISLKHLLRKMFHPDPKKRITLEQITYHQWIVQEFRDSLKLPSNQEETKAVQSSHRGDQDEIVQSVVQLIEEHDSLKQITVRKIQNGYFDQSSHQLQFPSVKDTNFADVKKALDETSKFFNSNNAEYGLLYKCGIIEAMDKDDNKLDHFKVLITREQLIKPSPGEEEKEAKVENKTDQEITANEQEEEKGSETVQKVVEEEKKELANEATGVDELSSQMQSLNLNKEKKVVVSEFMIYVGNYEDQPNQRFLIFFKVGGSELALFNFMDKFKVIIKWE